MEGGPMNLAGGAFCILFWVESWWTSHTYMGTTSPLYIASRVGGSGGHPSASVACMKTIDIASLL